MKQKNLLNDAQKTIKAAAQMEPYAMQEEILQRLVKKYPDHKNKAAVETKVKTLNLYYSTYIMATSRMTEHIYSEIDDFDARLKRGDRSLVNDIAKVKINGKEYDFYSFATKYCALHQPKKFPIYDDIVGSVLTKLFEDGNLPPYECTRKRNVKNGYSRTGFATKLRDYDFYVAVYDRFMELYGLKDKLTYREVDNYLWGAFKMAGPKFEIEKLAPIDRSKIKEVNINK